MALCYLGLVPLHSDFDRFKRAPTPTQPGTLEGSPFLPPTKPKEAKSLHRVLVRRHGDAGRLRWA
jgi:hypothetical protein